jgi:hypothetical protein
MAYGASESGKTYTILGKLNNKQLDLTERSHFGILPNISESIFERLGSETYQQATS